jgi:hypothetical protein
MIIMINIDHSALLAKIGKKAKFDLTAHAFACDVNKPRCTGYIKTQLCLYPLGTQPLEQG